MVVAPDPPRTVVPPRVGADEAVLAARRAWDQPGVDRYFLSPTGWAVARLAYAPFYVVERTLHEKEGFRDVIEAGPAAEMPLAPLDALNVDEVLTPGTPYDPAALRREAVVLDDTIPLPEAVPGRGPVLDERVRVVYLPLWLVEHRDGWNVHPSVIGGLNGMLLAGRAPVDRLARVPTALAIVYGLALLAAATPWLLPWIVRFLWSLEMLGLLLLALGIGGLFTLLAWSWDQVRFRQELVVEAGRRRREIVNRPARTGPERMRDAFMRVVKRIVT
jgi:hypothetical protein